ncbi:preprotein translocase subunit SecG [Methylobrevis albus]|uniref:Protein-export membrane protein SecG n=1 Tax=Methylobrevis albus TaxID=2793297 RepID=A0A931HZM1_9HYPH|nr:preprotein translocase subunit SecG [Methylobrevis albus]MBH0237027.1 preprotein translocase subunit SecG [Methylobrevis albus]
MQTVILVIHLMVVIALVGVVLLQRSEGGALGIGGGGGFMSSRGSANVLTRATAILAALFFLTSIALTLLPRYMGGPASIFDGVPGAAPAPAGLPNLSGDGEGILNQLQRPGAQTPAAPAPGAQAPASEAPATEAPAAPAPATQAPPAATPATPDVTPSVPAPAAPTTPPAP